MTPNPINPAMFNKSDLICRIPRLNPTKGVTSAAKTVPDATALKKPAVSFLRSFRAALFNILDPDRSNSSR